MATATLPLVQRTPLDTTLGGSQGNRAALAPAKRTPGRSETVQPSTFAELQGTSGITPGSFKGHQATGTDNSQPVLLRSFTELLSTLKIGTLKIGTLKIGTLKIGTLKIGTLKKLFSSSTKCSLILLAIIRFVGRQRQESALTRS
jgi:hypothetical protein